jgi:hypothetical protein
VRLKVVACEILRADLDEAAAVSPHRLDFEWLPMGLHEAGPAELRRRLQKIINLADPSACDALLLGLGACNGCLAGLAALRVPIVVPRVDDCFALSLGGNARYRDYVERHGPVYFTTPAWAENDRFLNPGSPLGAGHGETMTAEEVAARYGDDAEWILGALGAPAGRGARLAFVSHGSDGREEVEPRVRAAAERHGMRFESLRGDSGLLRRFLRGDWSPADFLVVLPGWQIEITPGRELFRVTDATRP